MKTKQFNLSEKRKEFIDEFIGHTNEEHPDQCACYICHHQEEFKKAFTELFEKIEAQDKEFIRQDTKLIIDFINGKIGKYELLKEREKIAGDKLIGKDINEGKSE